LKCKAGTKEIDYRANLTENITAAFEKGADLNLRLLHFGCRLVFLFVSGNVRSLVLYPATVCSHAFNI